MIWELLFEITVSNLSPVLLLVDNLSWRIRHSTSWRVAWRMGLGRDTRAVNVCVLSAGVLDPDTEMAT